MSLKIYLKLQRALSVIRNKRGDLNIQYLGIAALSVLVIAAILAVGITIADKWGDLGDFISKSNFDLNPSIE